MENKTMTAQTTTVMTAAEFLEQWQGHRRLTRKTIEAFPEKEFFNFSIGGMRPFSELVNEMMEMCGPGIYGIVTNEWKTFGGQAKSTTKEEVLKQWDEITRQINDLWEQIPEGRFQEVQMAFGQYENPGFKTILYFIDNEIHHRGQAFVYLRALGIQPPMFWDRS
ncbi:DinB family protein [Taibaiella soli]|uniref:Damage-inducible protein DinB n=1 Tax=Taibaiella soli TaxID=1649169 RepID=A0A2W2BFA5_9BACT|nr:DinB family protein [Taibaiella soli]PZF72186.1 damage-inducible protein DinB [Taibaiella soli]